MMSERSGYLKIAEIRRVPVFVHWSFPLGGLLVSFLGQVDPRQWFYYCLAYTTLVVIHELGHVMAIAILQLKLVSIEISGTGGQCVCERPRKIRDSVLVYTGGFIAQMLLFFLTIVYFPGYGVPTGAIARPIYITFTLVNFLVFVINLIPQSEHKSGMDTDGTVLWRLFLHVAKGHPHPHPTLFIMPPDEAPVFAPHTRLLELAGFRPPGFVHGIELLSDRTTPMEFVMTVLMTYLGLDRTEAIAIMLDIHNTGGILIPLPSREEAARIADAISAQARDAQHPLICRYACAAAQSKE